MHSKLAADMFVLTLPLAEKIIRPIVVYVFLIAGLRLACFPSISEDVNRKSGETRHAMVCPVHDELNASGYRAEFTHDQFVTNKREVIKDIALKVF